MKKPYFYEYVHEYILSVIIDCNVSLFTNDYNGSLCPREKLTNVNSQTGKDFGISASGTVLLVYIVCEVICCILVTWTFPWVFGTPADVPTYDMLLRNSRVNITVSLKDITVCSSEFLKTKNFIIKSHLLKSWLVDDP